MPRRRSLATALIWVAIAGVGFWYFWHDGEDEIASLNLEVMRLRSLGKTAEAAALGEQAAARSERALGKEHGKTLSALAALADIYSAQKRPADAASLLERVLEADRRILGESHRDTRAVKRDLAAAYEAQGRTNLAAPLRKLLSGGAAPPKGWDVGSDTPKAAAGPPSPPLAERLAARADAPRNQPNGQTPAPQGEEAQLIESIAAVNEYAMQLAREGKADEAVRVAQLAYQVSESLRGAEHPDTLTILSNLSTYYTGLGRYDDAETAAKEALEARERAANVEPTALAASLNNLADIYQERGRYPEAAQLFARSYEINLHTLGPEHTDTLGNRENLALVLAKQGRFAEAAPLIERVLEVRKRLFGEDSPQTLSTMSNLASIYDDLSRYAEAEALHQRAIPAKERTLGFNHPSTLASVNNLAQLYLARGRLKEAEPLLRRALNAQKIAQGKEHPATLSTLNNLAGLYIKQGRYSEAEPLADRALETNRRTLGAEHPNTLTSMVILGALYLAQGRVSEAGPLLQLALETGERKLGGNHPLILSALENLAQLRLAQARYEEAEPLLRRSLSAKEQALGRNHPDALFSAGNLGAVYFGLGRQAEAEPLLKEVLAGYKRMLGDDHPDTLSALGNLAVLLTSQGRLAEATPFSELAASGQQQVLGDRHPATLQGFNNLASLYAAQNLYAKAEPLHRRVLEGRRQVLGDEHPGTIQSLGNLASLYFAQGGWLRAAEFWRQSTAAIALREKRGTRLANRVSPGEKRGDPQVETYQFLCLIKALYRLEREAPVSVTSISNESFVAAQWAQGSYAAQSLAQMAARGAAGNAKLVGLVRERQDLVEEWRKHDEFRNGLLSIPPDQRNGAAETENNAWMVTTNARVEEIDTELEDKFPDHAALASALPLRIAEVQSLLGEGEALVFFLHTPEVSQTPDESFIWVVTKTGGRWARAGMGPVALSEAVQTLRCGLDAASCASGANTASTAAGAGAPAPFSHELAHRLYKALFGQVEDLIKGKSLLIVPTGPLAQLPFQVLQTKPPATFTDSASKKADWLIRHHALTVLPAVSSLKALRRVARPSMASKPLIGFGNPLFDGERASTAQGTDFKERAALARAKQRCPDSPQRRTASLSGAQAVVQPVRMRGGLADTAFLRIQAPLPETADELCAVAQDLGANPAEIRLGARATEREIKRLSAAGELAKYRIVHFATHGALAGAVPGNAEPGLLLTPPEAPSEEDDGYLSAPEIAALKLDADWVILSACNTAAGGVQNAEALSGLARAFIYAQARAMLVSHWAVNSDAAVKLITGAVHRLAADKAIGRAEALRRSMLALIDHGSQQEAHPAFWAPFVLVGEGAGGVHAEIAKSKPRPTSWLSQSVVTSKGGTN